MYIVIVGGGNVGYYLAKTLLAQDYEVTIIDWNRERIDFLRNELGDVALYENGTSIDGLEKAGCSRADVIVAATRDDEDNLAICQFGKFYFKIPKAIARITNPKNEKIFKELGVGTAISGTSALAAALERYVAKQSLTTLLTYNHDQMMLVEIELSQDSPVIGKTLAETPLPENSVVPLILRGDQVVFVNSNSTFMPKDLIIAITTKAGQDTLTKVLLGSDFELG